MRSGRGRCGGGGGGQRAEGEGSGDKAGCPWTLWARSAGFHSACP